MRHSIKHLKITKLNQRGFDHIIVLVGFLVVFGIIGATFLELSHAASWSGELQLGSDENLCLDNLTSNPNAGNTIDASGCNDTAAQKWTINELSGRTDRFTLEDGQGTCVDNTSTTLGGKTYYVGTGPTVRVYVKSAGCNSNNVYQQWEWEGSTLENIGSAGCINDPGSSTTPGTPQIVYGCNATAKNGLWYEADQKSPGGSKSSATECEDEDGNTTSDGCYFWAQGTQDNLAATGAQVTMSAIDPKVSSQDYHSDAEMYVSTENEKDSVEVCSIVVAGSSTPHLQIDYWKNGAEYENDFIAVSGALLKNGESLPTTGAYTFAIKYVTTHQIGVATSTVSEWAVYYNNQEIGYYPESVWGVNAFTQIQFVNVYGEVEGTITKQTTSQMGNGLLGSNPNSAYFSNYSLSGTSEAPFLTVRGPTGATAKAYDVGDASPTGFHYGGPGF